MRATDIPEIQKTNANSANNCFRRHQYYHDRLAAIVSYHVPPGARVLELGCGSGDLLAALAPGMGVGVDVSEAMCERAQALHPELAVVCENAMTFNSGEKFDFVVMSDLLGCIDDVWALLKNIRQKCDPHTCLIITQYNYLYRPLYYLLEQAGLKTPSGHDHWLSGTDMANLLELGGFGVIEQNTELLLPIHIPVISDLVNDTIAHLPLIRRLGTVHTLVAKPIPAKAKPKAMTVSVIVPTRNEKGNVAELVRRTPDMGKGTEIIFVDGASGDGTVEEIEKQIEQYKGEKNISLIHQAPELSTTVDSKMLSLGKGDAVRKGFVAAKGDLLMILDADMTVPPEDLPKFYEAVSDGHCEFANGSRLVYSMDKNAMRILNMGANAMFARIFSWLLSQPVKDSLCGTKVLTKENYKRIAANRSFFGDFDPFGDFDLLFGASKQHLKIRDVPILYQERKYGESKIRRWKHGWLLLRMCVFAFFRMKIRRGHHAQTR